eukprot:comp21365_c0_seq1/m.29356 comp21365_c0_seq1/g.29356  ORF comp21365_c0_seq1/g.29356 comp21365_c0_seq1/m.29356 type:complete len:293 (-) comp21365_c0_seq1:340-1218(-)
MGHLLPVRHHPKAPAWPAQLAALVQRKRRTRPAGFFVLCVLLCVLLWLGQAIVLRHKDKCDVTRDLRPLLLQVHDTFVAQGIEYFADGGTLLGLVRHGGILPTEHDVDVVVGRHDYGRLVGLKGYFGAQGLHLYVLGDYIFQKAWQRFWEWKPYLEHHPCARLYDQAKWYYVDIYCYDTVKGSALHVQYPYFRDRIRNPDPDALYHCKENDVPGGCQPASNNLPVSYIEAFNRKMPVPHRTHEVLVSMYGPDYLVPVYKGYKVLFCSRGGWWLLLGADLLLLALWGRLFARL